MKLNKEIEARLKEIPKLREPSPWKMGDYIGAGVSRFIYLNHRIPVMRTLFKQGFSVSAQPLKEQWPLWDGVWREARYFEAALMPLYFAEKQKTAELLAQEKILNGWLKGVDNWAHSDMLSSLYARMLEEKPARLSLYDKWSRSKNPWERRQSLVGLMCYARMRQQHPALSDILRLVEAQLGDSHYYVQKGVGWTLRESYNVYPAGTLKFLFKHVKRLSPQAWQAATEKLAAKDKRALKARRAL